MEPTKRNRLVPKYLGPTKRKAVTPVPKYLTAYVNGMANLSDPLVQVLGLLNQRELSNLASIMMPMEVTWEVVAVRNCIAEVSIDKNQDILRKCLTGGISYEDFHEAKPGFVFLTNVPTSQITVGRRGIDNRPAWLTDFKKEDFRVLEQRLAPYVCWEDKEWGIPAKRSLQNNHWGNPYTWGKPSAWNKRLHRRGVYNVLVGESKHRAYNGWGKNLSVLAAKPTSTHWGKAKPHWGK